MEYTVYILFSTLKNKFYIGFTTDIISRLIRHNQKTKVLLAMLMIGNWYILKNLAPKKKL